METIDKNTLEQRLDNIWKENENNSQKSEELGSYVDVETRTIRNAGIDRGSMASPGNFSTWRNTPSSGRYFMEGYGAGMTRLFKR